MLVEHASMQTVASGRSYEADLRNASARIRAYCSDCDTELTGCVERWRADREERAALHEVVHCIDTILGDVGGIASQPLDRCVTNVGSLYCESSLKTREIERVARQQRKVFN